MVFAADASPAQQNSKPKGSVMLTGRALKQQADPLQKHLIA
jgi:hypothetical protein